MSVNLLLEGGTLVTMDPSRRVFMGDLLVRDGLIEAVGEVPPEALCGRVVRRLDCRGRVILPGLIQSHVHLCQTLLRGNADGMDLLDWLREKVWPFEADQTYAGMRASARLGIAELVRGGTTACLDMGSVRHTDAVFEAASEAGFRLTCGKAMMDAPEVMPDSLRESTTRSLAESDALRERWHGAEQGRLRYAYAPRFVLSCTEHLLRGVAERAAEGALIHTHASENREELSEVRRRRGMDNVAYLHDLGLSGPNVAIAHCVWLNDEEKVLLSDTETNVLHCPSSNLKLGSGIAEVPELMRSGVPISLGADGAPCNNNLDMWMEMRIASLIHLPRVGPRGLTAKEVLEMATLGGAKALGIEHEVGSVEAGKKADLVVVNLEKPHAVPEGEDVYSRLVYSGRSSDVELVVIDGGIVLEQGMLATMDEGSVLSEARDHAPPAG